jgi:hypothetical protein
MRGLVVHGAHRVGFRTVPSAWSTQIMVGYSMVRFEALKAVGRIVAVAVLVSWETLVESCVFVVSIRVAGVLLIYRKRS